MLKRLPDPFGFAGRFMGTATETAQVTVTVTNCTFRARINNGPDITQTPFPVALSNGPTQDVSILLSGPNGASAVVVITPIEGGPEMDHMLIDAAIPFPINRYRFVTVSAEAMASTGG